MRSPGRHRSAPILLRARRGASTVEYGVMLALISVVLIVLIGAFAQNLKTSFDRANRPIADINASAAPTP